MHYLLCQIYIRLEKKETFDSSIDKNVFNTLILSNRKMKWFIATCLTKFYYMGIRNKIDDSRKKNIRQEISM